MGKADGHLVVKIVYESEQGYTKVQESSTHACPTFLLSSGSNERKEWHRVEHSRARWQHLSARTLVRRFLLHLIVGLVGHRVEVRWELKHLRSIVLVDQRARVDAQVLRTADTAGSELNRFVRSCMREWAQWPTSPQSLTRLMAGDRVRVRKLITAPCVVSIIARGWARPTAAQKLSSRLACSC